MTQSTKGFSTDVSNQKIGTVLLSTLTDAEKNKSYYVNIDANGNVTITETATNSVIDPLTGKASSK